MPYNCCKVHYTVLKSFFQALVEATFHRASLPATSSAKVSSSSSSNSKDKDRDSSSSSSPHPAGVPVKKEELPSTR